MVYYVDIFNKIKMITKVSGENMEFLAASHEDQANPGALKKVLFRKDDLVDGRVQMINWAKIPVGKGFNRHFHEDMEEVFIIVSGKAEIEIDGEKEILEREDAVIVPIGKIHSMRNVGDEEVVYCVVGISTGDDGKTIIV